MMLILYDLLFVPLARIIVSILSLFNKKVNEREDGASNSLLELADLPKETGKIRIWVHAASMGEFEQAKPVIEILKANNENIEIFTSFFSPSGFRNQKKYKFSDKTLYLPIDSKSNARKFVERLKPDYVLWTRYDIWLNFMREIKKRKIKSILICATKPRNALFASSFAKSYIYTAFGAFDRIFAMDADSYAFFAERFGTAKVAMSKDSRFDRIASAIESAVYHPVSKLPIKRASELTLIIGSSWRPDEEICIAGRKLLEERDNISLKIIFTPHEPTSEHIAELKKKVPQAVLLSEIELGATVGYDKDIIVDSIGKLLALYSFADCVFVGGAFGAGVHSVTEPAGYGVPLAVGTNISKSPDAKRLIELGALTQVSSGEEMYLWLKDAVIDEKKRKSIGEISRKYIFDNIGESKKIADIISKEI